MPIFEYRCNGCDHPFEVIVRSNREPVSCPKCHSTTVTKQLSVFNSLGSGKETAAAGGCACTPATCGCH